MAPDPTLLPRHPRRLGFVVFNAIVVTLIVAWLGLRATSAEAGLAGLPNLALTTAGIVVLAIVWIGSWIAWGTMVWNRRRARAGQVKI